jgi:subtilase family serine protease
VTADQADPDIRDNTATARTVATLANLVVKKLQAVAAAIPGSDIVIDDTTMNSGKIDAGASVTRFYLSTDAKFDAATDTFLSSRPIGALAAKADSPGSTPVTIPLATALGKYFLIGVADADNAVPETQENNKKSRRLQVTRPDLTVTALKAPASAAAGSSIVVQDTTSNKAPVPAGGPGPGPTVAVTRFYLSTDSAFDGSDAILGSRDIALPLAAKAKSAASTTVTIPPATVPGVYFVLAVADGDGAVLEINETNNLRSRKITITP